MERPPDKNQSMIPRIGTYVGTLLEKIRPFSLQAPFLPVAMTHQEVSQVDGEALAQDWAQTGRDLWAGLEEFRKGEE